MGVIFRLLFLSALSACSFADDSLLAPGQKLNDFSWPSAFNNQPGQRLAEQIGHPVMLIWTDDCDRCEEQLVRYQNLALGYQGKGLVSWVVWTPDGQDLPPTMRIPVLQADPYWRTGWQFESRPAVMLINAAGELDKLIIGRLTDNYRETEKTLADWMAQNAMQKP